MKKIITFGLAGFFSIAAFAATASTTGIEKANMTYQTTMDNTAANSKFDNNNDFFFRRDRHDRRWERRGWFRCDHRRFERRRFY